MKAHPLIANPVSIANVRERALVLAGLGDKFDAKLMLQMTDIIQQQEAIISALMNDAGVAYATLRLRFESTGTVVDSKESSNG